ncbi:MAG: PKD domain-containing protein [Candidatus Tritonobacter lacicola]|nr:PKD domain-containing protein [Candidatus Tritonobacter lacicola]
MKKKESFPVPFGSKLLVLFALACALALLVAAPSLADDLKFMSYNISAVYDIGKDDTMYQTRIVQGLEPDVALLQEWKLDDESPWGEDYDAWVEEAFGPDFDWYRGPSALVPPNAIVSRWPLKSSGSWNDQTISQRYFDWAVIDIPGDIDLQVVSVHLKAGDTEGDKAKRIDEAQQIKAYVAANFDSSQYIIVGGDFNTQTYGSEPGLIDVFDSFLQVEEESCQPQDRNGNVFTNVNRTSKYDWIIPNEVIGDASPLYLGVSQYQYSYGIVFDSTVFPSVETELPPILSDDSDHSSYADHVPVMKALNILPAGGGFYVMKADKGYDYNLYLYSSLECGDITYWDAASRNPSPIARDLWIIPSGNNTIAMTHLAMEDDEERDLSALALMKNEGGDQNLYIYNSILPGDWTYWDAIARNPSPIARDLWIVPEGNNTSLMTRTENSTDGIDELVIMKNTWGGQELYIYNALRFGDWTYTDSFLRNFNMAIGQFYISRDTWFIPRDSNVTAMAGMRVVNSADSAAERIVTIENSWGDQNLFVWKVPPKAVYGVDEYLQNQSWQIGPNPSIPPPNNMQKGYPQGQDLWIVPQRNDIQAIMGIGADAVSGDSADTYDVIGVLGNRGGDDNLWVWKPVQRGDTTYEAAQTRQDGYPRATADIANYGQPQARDFWVIPEGNNVRQIAAIPSTAPPPTPTPTDWIKADFDWDPEEPEEKEQATFTDKSAAASAIETWHWEFKDGSPGTRDTQGPHDVTWNDSGQHEVSLEIADSTGQTDYNSKYITIKPEE